MPGDSKAVFLSYASEDSEAAQRIADALSAAGIEVWFDKSELRGGDAWDQTIRHRIRDCTLFVPIISTSSEARLEGYFRREWKLAADRTDDMADGVAFLVPVVIDATPEASARVPERFRHLQWTRLPSGESTRAFAGRIQALLSADTAAPSAVPQTPHHLALPPPPPRRSTRWMLAGVMLVAVAVVSLLMRRAPATSPATAPATAPIPIKSVAILPFTDLSEGHDQEYFADGMTEEIIQRLSRVPDLRVPGRASSFYFKGKAIKPSDVARELGVANIVEGSVRKSGDQLRISAELTRVADGYTVWSDTFDRKLEDVFRIQEDIAAAVTAALQITLGGGSLLREQGGTRNLEAYQINLQAKHNFYENNEESLKRAIQQSARAVHIDPEYGGAWTNLADSWINLADHGVVPRRDACAHVRDFANRAVAASPEMAAGHASLGIMFYECDWNWPAAQLEIQRGLALNPNDGDVINLAANVALTTGRIEDAEASFGKAVGRDPFNTFWRFNQASALYLAGRYAEAEAAYRRLIQIAPDFGWARPWLAKTLLAAGKPKEALAELQPVIDTDDGLSYLPEVLIANDRKAEAAAAAQRLEKRYGGEIAFFVAQYYAYIHDNERALSWLERSYAQRDGWCIWIRGEPLLLNLKSDPRFKAFLRKMNVPE